MYLKLIFYFFLANYTLADSTLLHNEGIMHYENNTKLNIIKNNYELEKKIIDNKKNELKNNIIDDKKNGKWDDDKKNFYKNELSKIDNEEKNLINVTKQKLQKK